jgi:hypothetical protein
MTLRNVIWLVVFLQTLPMITVEKGSYTSSDQARQVVVRTADDWTKILRELSLRETTALPDFDQNMIVGVCLGSRPTAGYSVEIVSVTRESDGLVARYRETRPARDAMLAQVITSPCHFVAVPKLAGGVRFESVP